MSKPIVSPRSGAERLDMYYLHLGSALVETAATLDRTERAPGGAEALADPRVVRLLKTLNLLRGPGPDRAAPQAFHDYFTHISSFEPTRAAQYGIDHYCWICINPKEAEDLLLGTRRMLEYHAGHGGVDRGRVLFGHAEEHTLPMILGAGFWVAMTVCPVTKDSKDRVVDAVERYGLERWRPCYTATPAISSASARSSNPARPVLPRTPGADPNPGQARNLLLTAWPDGCSNTV